MVGKKRDTLRECRGRGEERKSKFQAKGDGFYMVEVCEGRILEGLLSCQMVGGGKPMTPERRHKSQKTNILTGNQFLIGKIRGFLGEPPHLLKKKGQGAVWFLEESGGESQNEFFLNFETHKNAQA